MSAIGLELYSVGRRSGAAKARRTKLRSGLGMKSTSTRKTKSAQRNKNYCREVGGGGERGDLCARKKLRVGAAKEKDRTEERRIKMND